jgi:ornithine cyclodeaminase
VRASVSSPVFLDADAVRSACPPARAVEAVEAALRSGVDPAADPQRYALPVPAGHLLLMPSYAAGAEASAASSDSIGVKVATVAPDNPATGLPRVQASYLLFDGTTLALRAVLDGTALTTLRTPAVSVAAVRAHLSRRPGPLFVVVVGAGPQATGHVATLRAGLAPQRPVTSVRYLLRNPSRRPPGAPIPDEEVLALNSDAAADALRAADVVVCATSARQPLFDSTLLSATSVVIAVGSHEPDAREVDEALCARATVVVEDVGTALREAGDVVLAVGGGALHPDHLVSMKDVVSGATSLDQTRPVLFKSVGMSWEDLVVARAVFAAAEPTVAAHSSEENKLK